MVRGEAGWVVEGGGVPSGIEYVVAGEAQLEIKPRNGFGSSREEGGAYWGFEGTTGGGGADREPGRFNADREGCS